MRLIPGYSLGKENWKAVICLFGAWGRHVPHVYEIPRKLAKSRSYCMRNGHGATVYSVTFPLLVTVHCYHSVVQKQIDS